MTLLFALLAVTKVGPMRGSVTRPAGGVSMCVCCVPVCVCMDVLGHGPRAESSLTARGDA